MAEQESASSLEAVQKKREMAPGVFTGDIGPVEVYFQQAREKGYLRGLDHWLAQAEDEALNKGTEVESIN